MVKRKTQDRTNSRIKLKICSTMFLYSKEEWIYMISTRLQKVELVYNKEQDIIINWRSNWQAKGCEILQQMGSYL